MTAAEGALHAAESSADPKQLFARENLVAWCIVPFDAKNRGPAERAEMLQRLGFRRFAYDWRDAHLPAFETEILELQKRGIELTAVWFPGGLTKEGRFLLDALKKHDVKAQLWVMISDPAPNEEQDAKIQAAAAFIRPIAEEAAKQGCQVALYNHGSWGGEPENQLAVIESLGMENVGIVYNLHHGHDHLARFAEILPKMLPHLLALNLNGMVKDGERIGKKILPLGQGELDLALLKTIVASGYRGPIGILGHTQDDAEQRLQDNLDGLDWLVPQLSGKAAGPKPKPRTLSAAPAGPRMGWLAEGKPEYRTPPLTVQLRARLNGKAGYNILVACDTKASADHWEIFTMPGSGHLTAYLPGCTPDHVRSQMDIADREWHAVAMQYEAGGVRLFVDGKQVAEEAVQRGQGAAAPGGLAFARLVEGSIGCDGDLDWVCLQRGVAEPAAEAPTLDEATLGLWKFKSRDQPAEDVSKSKNHAALASAAPAAPAALIPPEGVQLQPADARVTAVLLDRSENDSYLAVKTDGVGRVFVGGREAVYVFEPEGSGGFQPRRELLRFPQDSIIIGLEYRGDDLYVMTASALYLVRGGRTQRENLRAERILWGVPLDLHVSFHCLAWGPDGRLYLNHGDPLLNYGDWSRPDHWGHWTLYGPDGEKTPYTGAGAVLSIQPDGSDVRVVARGLRGPVGLAFDAQWNLFTNDNDHESRADLYAPARLLHVGPHADFSWPRGWMASKSPERSDLLEPVCSNLGREAPCDLAYYDEPLLPWLRGSLLMARWARMTLARYPLQPQGAGFVAEEQVVANGLSQARPSGIAVGRDGRLFVTTLYLSGNVVSPYCYSDLTMLAPAGDGASPFVPFEETRATAEELWTRLSGPSWETRRRVHIELLRRRGKLLDESAERLASVDENDPAARHLPWLAAATNTPNGPLLFRLAADRNRPKLRLQSLRALNILPADNEAANLFAAALGDGDPAVRLAALAWHLDHELPPPVDTVARLAASSDLTLRQTAARLLAARASPADLQRWAQDSDPSLRLSAVLAAGLRLTVPASHSPPPAGVSLHYPEGSAFFHRQIQFADAPAPLELVDLGPIGSYTTAQRWNATPHSPEEDELFAALVKACDDPAEAVRSQAAYYLSLLIDPRSEPLVARVQRELRSAGLAGVPPTPVTAVWALGPYIARRGAASESLAPKVGRIDLTRKYAAHAGAAEWTAVASPDGVFPFTGEGAAYAYFRMLSTARQPALLSVLAPGEMRVWHNSHSVPLPDGAARPALLDLQPGSNDVLVRLVGGGPVSLHLRARGTVAPELPEKDEGQLFAERLKDAGPEIPPEILAADWSVEAFRGDAEQGRLLFGKLNCAKCHAVTPDQTGGGAPSLAEAGKRFTPAHLAESILAPSAKVADLFRSTALILNDGRQLTGFILREDAQTLELVLQDATRQEIRLADLEERKPLDTSPMPGGLIKTADELRDLLTYLLDQHPLPP